MQPFKEIFKHLSFHDILCMDSQSSQATGLEYLLGLNGNIEVQNDAGYWVKMEVASVPVTAERRNDRTASGTA